MIALYLKNMESFSRLLLTIFPGIKAMLNVLFEFLMSHGHNH